MSIEAMKLALEALEDARKYVQRTGGESTYGETVVALRQAIEQAQQAEPVAWITQGGKGWLRWHKPYDDNKDSVPLYTTPPVATNDTTQERVAETSENVHEPCGLECDCTDVCKQTNYKALWQQMCERCDQLDKQLAQRKPLTDEEIKPLIQKAMRYYGYSLEQWCLTSGAGFCLLARAIEAAHGIKE